MALVELCKLDSKVNIRPYQRDEESTEPGLLEMNFINPQQLALPPVGNVSIANVLWLIVIRSYLLLVFNPQPVDFLKQFTHTETGKPIKFDFQHGTTTLGFVYQGGVLLAVDSRATGGQFIGKDAFSTFNFDRIVEHF
jgi:20S proteasome subunit beta 5